MISLPSLAVGLGAAGMAWLGYTYLKKDPLAQFDLPLGHLASVDSPEGKLQSERGLKDIIQRLRSNAASSSNLSIKRLVPIIREAMETFFSEEEKLCVCDFTEVDAGGVSAEWVVAPGVDKDNNRRLMYIHGGAFFAGSPKSHRVITSKLSAVTNSSVLAIDYRLMPEYSRRDSVEDCSTAYQWMLKNGSQAVGKAANSAKHLLHGRGIANDFRGFVGKFSNRCFTFLAHGWGAHDGCNNFIDIKGLGQVLKGALFIRRYCTV